MDQISALLRRAMPFQTVSDDMLQAIARLAHWRSYARGDLSGVASTAMGFFKKATSGDDTYKRNLRTKTSPADVIMWSGSKDNQTS